MKSNIILGLIILILVGAAGGAGLEASKLYNQNKEQNIQISVLNQKVLDLNTSLNAATTKSDIQQGQSAAPSPAPTNGAVTPAIIKGLDLSQFQSVHLSDGSQFFGKISGFDGNFVTLTDTFYIQGYDDNGKFTNMDPAQNMTLIKRGTELSGPQDSMTISLSNVTFIETLKSNSQVLMAIQAYQNNPSK